MILYRISSNKDPGAPASESLSVKDHTALLQEKKLLDLPKLMDICAIYGKENGELTRSLVANGIKAQPKLLEKTNAAVSHFLSIVHTMQQRCSSSLEVPVSSGGYVDHRKDQLFKDFLEVMDFVNDAIVTLDAFADAYNSAALYFSVTFETSYGTGELLSTLGRLHDLLIPSLQKGLKLVCNTQEGGAQSGEVLSKIIISLKMLSIRIAKFGWNLLDFCYLNDDLTEDSFLQTTTRMFPAMVEDPTIRADIIVQTLKEINGEVPDVLQENHNSITFIQNIERNHGILSRIGSLRDKGWIFMDGDQLKYLSQIALPAKSHGKGPVVPKSSINEKAHVSEDDVIMESKISQIKDLFPDYGKGFLSTCLQAYDHNPEEVIQRILEGTLHEDLLTMDTSLEVVLPPKSAPPSKSDKGKGVLLEAAPQKSASPGRNDKGKGIFMESASHSTELPVKIDLTGEQHAYGPSSTSLPSFGRFMRKSKDELSDSKVLDSTDKNAIKSAALAAEFEYEDEYDDSFDDLGLNVAESGFEEAENLNDRIGSDTSGSQNSSSKWGSQKKPQFFVKDGKNYSYKVAGSVAVANFRDAAVLNQSQRDMIHGLGRGGNIPQGAVRRPTDAEQQVDESPDEDENPARGNSSSRGRGGGGGRRGGRNHYRKDRAMKKHMSGLSGY